ncbi:MAG TPA: DUF4783 domain-containing protein [Bacteroidales bacterium]|nr:DUF4783 domain-containing protein [Bacteroidales bacterium]
MLCGSIFVNSFLFKKMKTRKLIITIVLLNLLVTIGFTQTQTIPPVIINALKVGNAAELAKNFNTEVELVILETEEVYSKAQSEIILKDFFAKNKPNDFKILHQGGKEDSKYGIGNLSTSNNVFRVYFLLKMKNEKLLIHQLRIEDNDE